MFGGHQILVSRPAGRRALALAALLALAGCGQKGPLYLPSDPAAAGRATLPETLAPAVLQPARPDTAPSPNTGTASPVRNP